MGRRIVLDVPDGGCLQRIEGLIDQIIEKMNLCENCEKYLASLYMRRAIAASYQAKVKSGIDIERSIVELLSATLKMLPCPTFDIYEQRYREEHDSNEKLELAGNVDMVMVEFQPRAPKLEDGAYLAKMSKTRHRLVENFEPDVTKSLFYTVYLQLAAENIFSEEEGRSEASIEKAKDVFSKFNGLVQTAKDLDDFRSRIMDFAKNMHPEKFEQMQKTHPEFFEELQRLLKKQ